MGMMCMSRSRGVQVRDLSDKGDFMGRIWGYPDTGLGKPFVSVVLVIYHSIRLSLEGVLDIQNSVEIMRLLDRHTRTEIKITTQRKRLLCRHTRPEIEITTQRNC